MLTGAVGVRRGTPAVN